MPAVLTVVMSLSCPCPGAQASCSCKPGMVSINHNASAGCFAYCFPNACDRSATCQVTPDGKTSCVCKEGEVGDGRACYGHLLHEVQKAGQTSMMFLRLRVALTMLDQGCREILTTSGPFTVLVPSISSILSRNINASLAQQLCKQHIIAGQHILEELGTQYTHRWWTLAGQEITVTFNRFVRKYTYKYKDQPQQTFTIHKANYPAANGVFHVVTALRWQPPTELPEDPKRTISQILASTEAFSRFETILELTVEKLISKGRVLTTANQVLAVNISEEGRILLGPEGVPLRRVDVLAANGVIHLLEGILLPPTILPILPKHCSEEQHKIVAGSCVDCQVLNTSTCPPNSVTLDIFPKECVYTYDSSGLNVLRKGCARYCNQTILKPGCCKGFFGPDCAQCPGGFSNPCYGKGNCSDGVRGNGACLCFPDYKGIACHICSNPNKHGDQCQEGDGYVCSPIDPCRAGNGGCHDLATCRAVGGGQRVCTCPSGYEGDGLSCYGDIFQELEANAHFSVFYQWIKSAGITLPAASRVTALVPSESAIRRLSPEDQAFWLQPRMLPQLVRAHFLQGALSEEELARLGGQDVATLSPTTRWEIHNISGRVWVQNASVDVADLLATNGVLHVLSQVLLPPRRAVLVGQGLLQQLDSVPAFRLFRELLQDADTVRHHVVLGEALSMEALQRGGHRNSLLGPAHWLVFYNHSGQEKCTNCTRKFRCTQGFKLEDTPKKSCVYRSGYSFSRGCSYTCAKKIQVCPEVPPTHVFDQREGGHGQCQDRLLGSGECRCQEGFHGTACEMCELGRYGPNCTGVCDCAHGLCQEGLRGDGSCVCNVGWQGLRCDQKVDPCAHDHGGCSPHANCTKVAPGQRTCTCQDGYTGDGELCQEINSCLIHHGGCHLHAECIPTGPQQNNGGCSPYAMCKSTGDGQRTCTCDAAHTVGDGFTCRARVGLEYKELKGDGPFTIFVPHADLMTNLSQDELARIRAHRQLVFRYHVVGCRQLRSQELLEEGYVTTLSGHPLRFSEKEGSIYLNDYARVLSSDQQAVNGVLHFIDRVLLPPDALHWEPDAAPIPRVAGLLPLLRDASHRPLTMLWPTDSALRALPPDRQAWLYHEDHRNKLAAILRGHVIRNIEALASDLPNLGPLRTMHGTPISFSCSRARPGELTVGEDDAHIVQRHLPFEGGLAYGIDQLLEPPGLGARCDRFETRPLYLKICSICGLEPPCPEGSQEQGSPEACWRYYSKFWTSPPLHSLALRSIWARPSLWGQPQGLGRGCHRNCVTTTWKPSCCPGHYGSECRACPGGASSPCSDHGMCVDGMSGSGQCRCRSGFAGTACELCAPGAFGPHCQACRCTSHGRCDEGLGGSGSCFCDEGWTGPHCEVQLVADLCQDGRGGCSEHASCSQVGTVVTCTCLPDYEGDGWSCRARDPCADGHRGGCSEHADCLNTGPNTRRCVCHTGYVGDGLQCLEELEPPVDRCLGQPPPCHVDAVCTDLHFQEKRAGVFHLQATSGPYGLNFSEAEAACEAQGAVLASLLQLSAAQQLGFHLCLVGWLANGSAAHPVVFPAADCGDGQVGVVSLGARKDLSECWDAYCYRVQDVSCHCRDGFVGDGTSVCNGKLLDILATTANFSTFYGMLLGYANATPRGLDFLDFLDDELTYKTLFVPVNEGFMDNMTLSGPDLELHASNTTFLSTNASQGTLLPTHSGLCLIISDVGPDNSSWAPVAPGAVVVSRVIVWDIMAFNGIIHTLASPLLAPPQPRALAAPEAPPVAVGAGAVVAAGALLGLVVGALYLRARGKATGFGFSAFQAEGDADDDFSPWQEGTSPTLVSVPNPVFGSHDTFCEPFDDSLLEEDFPDTQRILAVK
ncbi:hypothetical protein HPG69_008123 [Diceros bicornis minor]|uniref:Stabilin-1 n=1 Tax=Diceros bicornis minor TaxID=77932 RepID=A0A7J7F3X7_DICBM|nr:hypothetical protein HPG69_008123 [Diceros bicornis minor]